MWVAIAGASVITAGPWLIGRSRSSRAALSWFIAAIAVGLAALVVTGLGSALLQRALEPRPRSAGVSPCGGPLLERWTVTTDRGQRAGFVPMGTRNSPMIRHEQPGLQGTPIAQIFQVISGGWAPRSRQLSSTDRRGDRLRWSWRSRQPVVGRSSPSPSPAWAAIPPDFAFLVVLAIGWAAYVSPREAGVLRRSDRELPVRLGSVVALAIVAVAYSLDVRGSFAYDRAREAVVSGDLAAAASALGSASALDPGLALYPREAGGRALSEAALFRGHRRARACYRHESRRRPRPGDPLGSHTTPKVAPTTHSGGRPCDRASTIGPGQPPDDGGG